MRWLVGLAALGLAVKVLASNEEAWERLGEFRLWQVGAVCGLFAVYFVVRAWRLLLIMRAVGGLKIGFREWFKVFIVGRFANALVAQAGNVYRAAVLKRQHGLPYGSYVSALAFFTWVDALLNLLLAAVLLLAMNPGLMIGGLNGAATVGLVLAAVLAGPPLALAILGLARPGEGFLARVREGLRGMLGVMVREGRNAALMARLAGLGLVLFGIWIVLFRMSFAGMGIRAGLGELGLFLAIYKLTTILVITPGSIGVREIAYGLLGECLGIGMAQGVMVSAILRVASYSALFPLGLAFGGAQVLGSRSGSKDAAPPGQ
jgi:hypothetical protein